MAIANPDLTIVFQVPQIGPIRFERAVSELLQQSIEIKLHPHDIEFGQLMKILNGTDKRTLLQYPSRTPGSAMVSFRTRSRAFDLDQWWAHQCNFSKLHSAI
ncbi:MAG: hypothetical protein WCA36_21750 [Pseudolabrys sp.]